MNAPANFRLVTLAQEMLGERRARGVLGMDELLGEPAWDVLLFLYVEDAQVESPRTKAACQAAGVPQTTALRYVALLEEWGLIERRIGEDGRCRLLRLSRTGRQRMTDYLAEVYAERRVSTREGSAWAIGAQVNGPG